MFCEGADRCGSDDAYKSRNLYHLIMKKLFALLALLLAPSLAYGNLMTFDFSGQLDKIGPFGEDFGFGVAVGDPFSGSFSYDTNQTPLLETAFGFTQYAASSFIVNFPQSSASGTNLTLSIQLFDGFLEWVNIQGLISPGLFMDVGFTNGFSVLPNNLPPTFLSCADWFSAPFKLNHHRSLPSKLA